ncbi:MAG: glycosyltransferase [Chitinivibrionales bacterium]|nr:glycosyltransferase [Chitinivibrionales bacterium]
MLRSSHRVRHHGIISPNAGIVMDIAILALGSEGDVRPYVAVGRELCRRGHAARIVTHGRFAELVESNRLGCVPLSLDPKDMIMSSAGRGVTGGGVNRLRSFRRFLHLLRPAMIDTAFECARACEGAHAVVYSLLGSFVAQDITELRGVGTVGMFLQPYFPTGDFPFFLLPSRRHFGRLANRLSWVAAESVLWATVRTTEQRFRTEKLGLPPLPRGVNRPREIRHRCRPLVHAFSPSVVPKPTDWGADVLVTGYCFLDTPDWAPPKELTAFLESGPPPVCVGFGSMGSDDPANVTGMICEALRRAGQRGVLLTGWGGMDTRAASGDVLMLDWAPHEWLFPRVAAVVHHGGAGTTAAALRAGTPSIVMPGFGDQFFWADRVKRLGAGPTPIARRRLSVAGLARAVSRTVSDRSMALRAAEIGTRIREEDGLGAAADTIEKACLRASV